MDSPSFNQGPVVIDSFFFFRVLVALLEKEIQIVYTKAKSKNER